MVHPARQARLAESELAAGGVEREVAGKRQVVVGDELHAFALLAEPRVLQREQHGDRVAVVDGHHVHVRARQIGHAERLFGGLGHRGVEQVGRIGGGLERDVLAEALDPHRPVAGPIGDVRVRDDHRGATHAGHDDLEHVQRVGDDRAGQHVVDGERLVLPDRALGVIGVDPLVDDDLGHRPLVVTVDRTVAGRHLTVGPVLAEVAVRDFEFRLGRAVLVARRTEEHRVHQRLRLLLRHRRDVARRQCAQHHIAQTQFDGRGRPPHHRGRAGAAEVDEFGEIRSHAEVFGDG
nr:hypothetical protein CPGR_00094 [Mycolicibacterium malmesburyense]